MTTSTFVFNQYYIDLLKKIKNVAKKHKDKSNTAKCVLKAIKDNYITLDKSSDEYVTFLNENFTDDIWNSYIELENNETINDWFKDNGDLLVFNGITLIEITKLLRDDYLCHHYCTVFYIFKNTLSDEVTENIVKILQSSNKELVEQIEDEKVKSIIKRLDEIRIKNIKDKSGIDMKGIEDTTLGKLAKEILQDVDVDKLQKSMGDNGDILKAIGDPDSGFSELITNVSKKMATKMSNGELKQENLIQDAMKFASLMPGMFGGATGGNNAGNRGNNRGGVPNMSEMADMMNMMQSMMSGVGGDGEGSGGGGSNGRGGGGGRRDMPGMSDLFKNMAKDTSGKKKTSVSEGNIRKLAKIKQLRTKLHKKNSESNNDEIAD
jgi:hypothetical protein